MKRSPEADARGTGRNARRRGYRAGSGGSTRITAAASTRAWAVPRASPPGAGRGGGARDVRGRVAGASPGAGEQRRTGLRRAGGRRAGARPRAGLHHRQRLLRLHAERHRAALRQCVAGRRADGHRPLGHADRPGRGHFSTAPSARDTSSFPGSSWMRHENCADRPTGSGSFWPSATSAHHDGSFCQTPTMNATSPGSPARSICLLIRSHRRITPKPLVCATNRSSCICRASDHSTIRLKLG